MNRPAAIYLTGLRYILGLLIFGSTSIFAQSSSLSNDYNVKHWTMDDGLPINEIVDIAQTQDGYIWLATFDGLVRFDGDQFTVFNTGNTPEFPTNRFIKLKVDRHNNLWIVTDRIQNDKVLIAYHGGEFTIYDSQQGVRGNVNLQLDPKGNILVGSENGAFYYDGKTLQSFGDKLKKKIVRNIVVDSNGAFWFATNQGIFQYTDDNWVQFTEQNGLNSTNTYAIHIDQQGKVYMVTDVGINIKENDVITSQALHWLKLGIRIVNIHENPLKPGQLFLIKSHTLVYTYEGGKSIPYPNIGNQGNFKSGIFIDPSNVIWAHMDKKLYRNKELIYTTNSNIKSMIKDNIGNIWLAQRDGLIRLKSKFIRSYTHGDSGSGNFTLTEDSYGEVWSTQNFMNVLQLKDSSFHKVNDKIGIPFPRPSYSIYTSDDDQVWIGTVNGVFKWDRKHPIQLLEPPSQGETGIDDIPAMYDVKAIEKDAKGNMWFGSTNGIHKLDKGGGWSHFGKIGNNKLIDVRLIQMTRDSILWFGTNGNGLLYLKDGKLNQVNKIQGLSGNIIHSMHEDKEGILWVGTEGWGLNRIERMGSEIEDARITIYNNQNGLFDNVIHQILEDDYGRFWMSSNRGIFWVSRSELNALAKGEISSVYSFFYSEQDGLPGREANGGIQPAGFKSRKGELWFPMVGGVARIDPDQVKTTELNLVIEQFSTSDTTCYVGNNLQEKLIPLGQRFLQIKYAAIDLTTNPNNIKYRYKLDGVDQKWIEAGNSKEAVYNRLPPGSYTFRVMANNGGGWLGNEVSLKLTFPYFFYETYWFYGIILLLIILVVVGGVNWRIRMLKEQGKALEKQVVLRTHDLIKEKEETERQKEIATAALETIEKQAVVLKELDQAKSRFFTNISHEFRTPLTLIIGPLEDQIEKLRAGLTGDEEDMEVALRNSKRLLHLVNQILEVAKLESGHTQLQVQLIDICSVIDPIIYSFKTMSESKGIDFQAVCPDEAVMMYIDTDLIEKAITNLLSNAFKFTSEHGAIEVWVRNEEDKISISVKDNGLGIPKEDQEHIFERFYQVNESIDGIEPGTGIGLSLVHEVIVLHGGTIELISEPGIGSEFLIELKKGKAHLKDIEYHPNFGYENTKRPEGVIEHLIENQGQPILENSPNEDNNDRPLLLIVEDNADIRRYVYKHMSTEYNVIEAENGLEGFQKTEESLPDLVISDVMMPLSDGYDLCRKIKQHPDLDFIPVILLTAKAEKSMKIEGLDLGADDYITKPFEIDELKARVRNLIKSRQKLKERLTESELTSEDPDQMGWVDTPFTNRVRNSIEQHIGDEDFNVVQLAEEVGVGRTTLYSRILESTGKTPSEMIKLTRLYQAAQLLKEDAGNISEIAYATGFKSISHFSKTFKAEFKVSPTEYKRSHIKA